MRTTRFCGSTRFLALYDTLQPRTLKGTSFELLIIGNPIYTLENDTQSLVKRALPKSGSQREHSSYLLYLW